MKKLSHNGNEEKCQSYSASQDIKFTVKSEPNDISNSAKVFKSHPGDRSCSPRVTARALSSANRVAISQSKPLDFIGMNISTVITTGSLSSKGVNFGSSRAVHYIHGETGINFGDFMPADRDFSQRIDDDKSLIGEDNFGMDKNQIKDGTGEQTPGKTGGTATKSVIQNINVSKVTNGKEGDKCQEVATSWAKSLEIAHKGIISCANRRAA